MDESSIREPGTGLARKHGGLIPVAEYMRMSMDHQRYSIEFQSAAIRTYAVQNQMSVVRTYLDDGKSGLDLKGRAGLRALLRDVVAFQKDFAAVLVYDVSRWGRFQDSDESAFYEFMCKQAGIRVIYCAEPFDDTPMGGLFKNIKRVMAGEYSRALSARIWGAQAQHVRSGFKPGGVAGYGFRRYLLSFDRIPKGPLRQGEWKAVTSDKVILVPGPRDEVETVWRIYDSFILDGKEPEDIANELNARACRPNLQWTRHKVYVVLSNPKYMGVSAYNRTSQKLHSKQVKNPESQWVLREWAYTPLVSRDYFELAAEIRRDRGRWSKRTRRYSREAITSQLKSLLQKEGYLSMQLIDRAPGIASSRTVLTRFGSMHAAYAAAGICALHHHPMGTWNKQRVQWENRLAEEMLEILSSQSVKAEWDARTNLLWVCTDHMLIVAIFALRCHYHRKFHQAKYLRWDVDRLHLHQRHFDECLVVRMNESNSEVYDYHVFPRSVLEEIPKRVVAAASRKIATFRVESLPLLASRWKFETSNIADPRWGQHRAVH